MIDKTRQSSGDRQELEEFRCGTGTIHIVASIAGHVARSYPQDAGLLNSTPGTPEELPNRSNAMDVRLAAWCLSGANHVRL